MNSEWWEAGQWIFMALLTGGYFAQATLIRNLHERQTQLLAYLDKLTEEKLDV